MNITMMVAFKEMKVGLLNNRFVILALIATILLPLSAVINYGYYQERVEAYEAQYSQFRQGDPEGAQRAYRRPELMSSVVQGLEPLMPTFFEIPPDGLGDQRAGPAQVQEFGILATLGSMDVLFIIVTIFSLLAILVSYDSVCGEKERGTLRQMLSNSVPRERVLLGKLLGQFLLIFSVFLIGFALMLLVLAVLNQEFVSASLLPRFGTLLLIGALVIITYLCLGTTVSSFSKRSSAAIVTLLLIWVVLQLVIPKSAETISEIIRPVTALEFVNAEKESVVEDIKLEASEAGGALFRRVFQVQVGNLNGALVRADTPESALFKSEYAKLMARRDSDIRNGLREIASRRRAEVESRKRLTRFLSLFSPASAATMVMSDVTGTGDLDYARYLDDAALHFQVIDDQALSRKRKSVMRLTDETGSATYGLERVDIDWDSLPVFESRRSSLRAALSANLGSVLALLLYPILLFVVAWLAFRRYDPR